MASSSAFTVASLANTRTERAGFDLPTLGLPLESTEPVLSNFSNPLAQQQPVRDASDYSLPYCYVIPSVELAVNIGEAALVQVTSAGIVPRFIDETLFYAFYGMPQSSPQVLAAIELANRGWKYDSVDQIWLRRDNLNWKYFDTTNWQKKTYDGVVDDESRFFNFDSIAGLVADINNRNQAGVASMTAALNSGGSGRLPPPAIAAVAAAAAAALPREDHSEHQELQQQFVQQQLAKQGNNPATAPPQQQQQQSNTIELQAALLQQILAARQPRPNPLY